MVDYSCDRCGYKLKNDNLFIADGCVTGYHCPHCGYEVDWDIENCEDPLEGDF